jgi:hypothetical protein
MNVVPLLSPGMKTPQELAPDPFAGSEAGCSLRTRGVVAGLHRASPSTTLDKSFCIDLATQTELKNLSPKERGVASYLPGISRGSWHCT